MRMTRNGQRGVALIVLGVFILVGLAAIFIPLWMGELQNAKRVILEARIEELNQMLINRETVLADLRERERVDPLEPHLLSAPTASLAAVALAGLASHLLERAGGLVISTEVLDPVPTKSIWQVGVRLRFTIDIWGLRSLLYDIKDRPTLLLVEQLVLQSRDNKANSRELQIELLVVGYTRARPRSA